jgi:tetratricopeptide (TPR) repeat protein
MTKKKQQSTSRPLLDRRAAERTMAYSHQLMSGKNFQSLDELNAFVNSEINGRRFDQFDSISQSPGDKAQFKMYDAFAAEGRKNRVALAREALSISADCADAYVLLAEETATNNERALELYRQGVEAGRRSLGAELFVAEKGNFWSNLKTRPFMRALSGYADCLYNLERHDEAFLAFIELMNLNPQDNQGIRMILGPALVECQRYDEAKKFLSQYKEEASTYMKYSWALLLFRTEGNSIAAIQALDSALAFNKFVPGAFLNLKEIMRTALPEHYSPGSFEESVLYVHDCFVAWVDENGAGPLGWMLDHIENRAARRTVFDVFPGLVESASQNNIVKGNFGKSSS